MVDDATQGIESANSGARIDATIVNARLVARTLGIDSAFRSARHVRISTIVGRTNAGGRTAVRIHNTVGVRAARM